MADANYNPQGIVELMKVFEAAQSGGRPPEFLSTHPNPGNRIEQLTEIIQATYPNGVPGQFVDGEQQYSRTVDSRLR